MIHFLLLIRYQLANLFGFALGNKAALTQSAAALSGLFGKNVALIGLCSLDLAGLGNAEAFCGTPMGLDFRDGVFLLY